MTSRSNDLSSNARPARSASRARLSALLTLTMLPLLTPGVSAQDAKPAQSQPAQSPQWMAVTSETEPVRCGDQEIYYTIEEFKQGTLLASDGTSGQYTKVRYPAELGVFVAARDVQTILAGSQVRLINASQLSAASQLRGFDGSWCPVYEPALPAGTELAVMEVMHNDVNDIVGYRVAPPRPPVVDAYPYAYIRTSALRQATPEEIKEHQGGKQIPVGRPALTASPGRPQPAGSEPDQNTDLRDPMTTPQGVTEPKQATQSPEVIKNTIPVVVDPASKPAIDPSKSGTPSRLTVSGLEALEASFTSARTMPREQLDEALPELLAEFTRARDAAEEGDLSITPIEQRIEWINLRIQTRDQRRAIEQALNAADQQSIELSSKMDAWNASRVYTMVGRLMLSGVYTGEHLPLLYRLRSPDPVTGVDRTVGYIAPRKDQDLRQYLGRVVGVIGDPVRDDALAMSVITPSRVDLMPGQ